MFSNEEIKTFNRIIHLEILSQLFLLCEKIDNGYYDTQIEESI